MQKAEYWYLGIKEKRFLLAFLTESEGVTFCSELLSEIGGILRIIYENGTVRENIFHNCWAVGCEPAGI